MKPNQPQQAQSHASATPLIPTQSEKDFVPSPDEIARHAYFAYENNGSKPGHEVQHWLEAEAKLQAERKLTRTHGFHNQT